LMPALSRVRQIAYQMICGTNLAGIGKAILVYGQDNEDEYPVGGPKGSPTWSQTGWFPGWHKPLRADAWKAGRPTITASFYLLVKFSDLQVGQFVCKSDSGTSKFSLSDAAATATIDAQEDTDCWDFGTLPGSKCSYAYALPYGPGGFPIGSTSSSTSPVAADRNPYIDKNAKAYILKTPRPEWDTKNLEYLDVDKNGNASAHQQNGQNVLFNDVHVAFEKYPNVGIDQDNIYRAWNQGWTPVQNDPTDEEKQVGGVAPNPVPPAQSVGKLMPMSQKDAYLVNEHQEVGKI